MVKSADIATFDTSDSWQERTIRKLNYNFMKLYELFSGSIPFATEAGHAPTNKWSLGLQINGNEEASDFAIPTNTEEVMVVADINRNGANYHHILSCVFPVSAIRLEKSQYDLGGYSIDGAGAWFEMSPIYFRGINSYIASVQQIANTTWKVYVR